MSTNRRLLAGALGLALLVAACGGSSTATASPTSAASQAAASGTVPTSAPSVPSGPAVSLAPGQASDLEAMLPNEAGGVKFTKRSFDGATMGTSGMNPDAGQLATILKDNGKTVADVRMAVAAPTNAAAGQTAAILAFQIKGVDATKLVSLVAGSSTASWVAATVGGKQVQKSGTDAMAAVIYTKGDVLFEVLLANAATAEAIVAALP